MAKQSVRIMKFPYPPERVLEVLTDPEFQVANFKKQGHPDAKVSESSRNEQRLVMEAEVTEYAKGITGIDKSKTEITHTRYEWNLKDRTAKWKYDHPQGARVNVWGNIRIRSAGDGAELTEEFNVEIKVPLVGGRIEKMVLKEADAFWPKYEALVSEFLAKKG